MKKILLTILGIVGTLLLIGIIAVFAFGYSLKKSLEPKIDPTLYADIIGDRKERSDRYSFLPDAILTDATNVAFFHVPGFLQGGDVIALRLALSPEQTQALEEELENSGRTEISSFEDTQPPYAYPAYGMKKPGSDNMFRGVSTLPEDFRIFLYLSDLEDIKEHWNHNTLSFTAISTNRNEVVYFIDSW